MDFFGSLFGNKNKNNNNTIANNIVVINNLRDKIEILNQRNKYIDGKVAEALLDAKTRLDIKDKNGALISLKRKKMFEEEIEKNNGMLLVLENQIFTLEGASMNKQLVEAMTLGQSTIKKIHNVMDPTKIEDLMDDINESNENHKMIHNAMAQPLRDIYNDDELLEELEELDNINIDVNSDIERLLDSERLLDKNKITLDSARVKDNKNKNNDEDEDEDEELRRMVTSLN